MALLVLPGLWVMARSYQQFVRSILAAFSICACSAHAQFWGVTTAPQAYWSSLAISADATQAIATVALTHPGTEFIPGGPIYVSKDSGASWQMTSAPVTNWACVASSADGTRLAAGVGDFFDYAGYGMAGSGLIYTSTNSGDSWTATDAPTMSWVSIASSADGTKLAAAPSAGAIFTSTNFGMTWMAVASPTDSWSSVTCSADGNFLAAASGGQFSGSIYISTNGGLTWAWSAAPTNNWSCIAASADGTRLVAGSGYSYAVPGNHQSPLYVSTNSGATWAPTTAPHIVWLAVASSADGSTLAGYSTRIFTSMDSGATWTRNTAPNDYWSVNCLAVSADGEEMFGALSHNGLIYRTQPGPVLDFSLSTTNLLLSWPWYATNFTLQESFDLSTPNWTNVVNTPVVTNLQNQLMIESTVDKSFFRLKAI